MLLKGPKRSGHSAFLILNSSFREALIFPLKGSLFEDVDKATEKEGHEHQDSKKSGLAQLAEVDRIRIEEDDLDVEKHEQNGYQKIFNGHRLTRIPNRRDTALEAYKFIGSFAAGTEEVGESHHHNHEAGGDEELECYR